MLHVTSEVWESSYPDLAGKVAVLAGTSSVLAEVARVLGENGAMCALVVDDRAVVERATTHADQLGIASFGIVADPSERGTWDRVAPHIEQRLGPIDVVVAIGPPGVRATIASALMPDMAARRRGVIVEAGATVKTMSVPAGLRHRAVSASEAVSAQDVAAAIALCASDVLAAADVNINLADR
jgi:hypothetical protein